MLDNIYLDYKYSSLKILMALANRLVTAESESLNIKRRRVNTLASLFAFRFPHYLF